MRISVFEIGRNYSRIIVKKFFLAGDDNYNNTISDYKQSVENNEATKSIFCSKNTNKNKNNEILQNNGFLHLAEKEEFVKWRLLEKSKRIVRRSYKMSSK